MTSRSRKTSRSRETAGPAAPLYINHLALSLRHGDAEERVNAWLRVSGAARQGGASELDLALVALTLGIGEDSIVKRPEKHAFYEHLQKYIVPLAEESRRRRAALPKFNEKMGYTISPDERRQAHELNAKYLGEIKVESHRFDKIAEVMGIKSGRVRTIIKGLRKGRPENRGKRKARRRAT